MLSRRKGVIGVRKSIGYLLGSYGQLREANSVEQNAFGLPPAHVERDCFPRLFSRRFRGQVVWPVISVEPRIVIIPQQDFRQRASRQSSEA